MTMPYSKISELPENVKILPKKAQSIFMSAFNSALEQYGDEETARKVAWGAVKKSYKKEGEKWVSKNKESMAEGISIEEIQRVVENALANKTNVNLPQLTKSSRPWLVETYDDFIIYEDNGKTYRADYTIDDEMEVEFSNIVEVKKKVSYEALGENVILHTMPIVFTEPSTETSWNDITMDGSYISMQGNTVDFDENRFKNIIKNFDEGVRGQDIPVTFDHPQQGGIAAGWLKSLRVADRKVKDKSKKVLQGLIDWTPTGMDKVKGKEYKYISLELLPESVLKAVSLVNFPAVKGMNPVSLLEEGYEHIFLMGGDMYMEENQENFASNLAEQIVEKLKDFFMDKNPTKPEGKKEKRHLPENPEGQQWCVFMDGKKVECGPDEAWVDEKLGMKEKKKEEPKTTKTSEQKGGEEDRMADEQIKKLIEDTVTEKTQKLSEENVSLQEQLNKSNERLAEMMEDRRLEKLGQRVKEALRIDAESQYTPAVGDAIREVALAEPAEYEDKLFALMELLRKPEAIVKLGELGTATGEDNGTALEPDSEEFFTAADKRAKELMKEQNITDYKEAAAIALAEMRQSAI
jgi:cation transport regulator